MVYQQMGEGGKEEGDGRRRGGCKKGVGLD